MTTPAAAATGAVAPPAGRRPLAPLGARAHLAAAALALAALLLGLALATALLARAAADPARTGPVWAFFPPAWGAPARFAATLRAGGLVRADPGLRLPGAPLEAAGEAPGLAARLRREGAWLVLAPPAGDALALGGCSGPGVLRRPAAPRPRPPAL